MNDIKDIETYNQRMAASMIDKIYFMDKVDATEFIDIGCADGHMLKVLADLFPQNSYLGYDNNPAMIEAAKAGDYDNLFFTSDWEELRKRRSTVQKTCVILSSMIHEVYSYKGQENFWRMVWDTNAEYIAIRDMAVSKTASRPSDPITVARIRQVYDSDRLNQWQAKWGSLEDNWSLTHFLLSYHYENWEREYQENYLPLSVEELLKVIPVRYKPIFIEHYTLPYIRRKVKKEFGVELQERTHVKLVLERT